MINYELTPDKLMPLDRIREIYQGVLIPYNRMTKYYPNSRVQIWKAAAREYLVVDTKTFTGILVCQYYLAHEKRNELIVFSNLV
jgi:hypothetical protein